jgi:hypothetical protein
MITDEDLESFPEDPQLAFVEFERLARRVLFAELEQVNGGEAVDDLRLEYMNKVVGAAKAYGIDGIRSYLIPSRSSAIYTEYADFLSTVDHYTIQIRIHAAARSRKFSVALDASTKSKIRHFVEQIKVEIEKSDLPVEKREALLAKLNAFLTEVDRTRTTFQAIADAWLLFCDVVGEGFEKLEPARKWLDSIARVMGRAKELEDLARPRLPSVDERPRLEPPRKGAEVELDDEIPF